MDWDMRDRAGLGSDPGSSPSYSLSLSLSWCLSLLLLIEICDSFYRSFVCWLVGRY